MLEISGAYRWHGLDEPKALLSQGFLTVRAAPAAVTCTVDCLTVATVATMPSTATATRCYGVGKMLAGGNRLAADNGSSMAKGKGAETVP